MEEYINNESAEMEDVADLPEDVESAETQEAADPETEAITEEEKPSGKNSQDSAFAEMRRRAEQAERDNKILMDSLGRYFTGDTAEELSINANAYAEQRDPDEYRQEWEANKEVENLRNENEELKEQLLNAQVERLMHDGLREVQEIDPNVKSLDELGENFITFVSNGMTTKQAYYATKTMEANEKVFAPSPIGKVQDTKVERDYYTSEELDHLTDSEMEENWDKVMRSMNRL